ncbi:hypothetical protein PC116_g22299 [Phytophthora cactorum]|uniref:Uncharacterized protein n=2 Tax=Phytophthora cactorum TaxID=29920 RepID=A0A8T0YJX5_9STRA|nr:hypothetical protein PC113_g18290 [Phytophthora cactorum]KAG2883978.1 hypothetical protein PC114_g20337 [Phytophthora cactorum]KAG2894651.1 hypothetical protein PC115_g18094 [Phytophthora cactorum]KAG2909999.1 hypothetical protein PC117_g19518 [Phytophthora cactorum]KAG2990295.1 hypothetical protein PC119_g19120 [Phytophthora cactorum]
MRAFMRAIGLGGLFRRSANSTAKASTANNTAGSFRVLTLEQFEKMTTVDNSAVFEARRSSSTNERPQFLFFCGSDNSAFPSGELTSPNGSTLASRFASMNAPTPAQPVIDHHMPVFFMPPLSPSRPSLGACRTPDASLLSPLKITRRTDPTSNVTGVLPAAISNSLSKSRTILLLEVPSNCQSRDPVRYSERLKGFQRPMTVQEPSQSPVIYSKQRCRSVVVLILQL